MSGPADGLSGPPTGGFDTAAIAAAGNEQVAPARHGASRLVGHDAADSFSTRTAPAGRVTPLLKWSVADGVYLRAMLGNLYFALPLAGLVLGVIAGISTNGLAVPPTLTLTLVLIALGAIDGFAGLMAFAGFAVVTLITGNLLGSGMISAPPGQQNAVYTLGGLLGLATLWFVGAGIPERLRPLRLHREGSSVQVWSRRVLDFAFVTILGTFIIWFAAWQMPTLTGNTPQELFVTIQDHLLEVKVVAFVAILAKVVLQSVAAHHFEARMKATGADVDETGRGWIAWVFFLISGAFALIVLWEFLAFGWMTWVLLALFFLVGIAAWAGRRLGRHQMGKRWFPLNLIWFVVVVAVIGLLLSHLTRHLVNPTPMLGGIAIALGILIVVSAFFGNFTAVGQHQDWATLLADLAAITLLVLLVYGTIGFNATPFNEPHGVYIAPTGSVFVADTNNNRVVLVWKNGYRETIGVGLNHPADVVGDGDPKGYVYIADAGNNRVVRLDGYYNYTVGSHTFNLAMAESGTQVAIGDTTMKDPQGLSVNGLGDVFVADTGNNRILEISRKTFRAKVFLKGLSGPLAVLADPFYTATVYVANTGKGTVIRILPNGKKSIFLSGLDKPAGLAEDPWGNFYVSEMGNGKILEYNTITQHKTIIDSGLGHPRGISVDALGNLFVTDSDTGQVKIIASLREHDLLTHGMPDPSAVAYAPTGAVYVVDKAQGWLQAWDHGSLRTVATGLGHPIGVAYSATTGKVFVDLADGSLLLVDPSTGTKRLVAATLDDPKQLWGLPNGDVLVAEKAAGAIVEVTPSGQTITRLHGLKSPVAVTEDVYGTYTVGLQDGDVYSYPATGKRSWLFNLRGITAMASDKLGNVYTASWKYRLVVMHVAATGRDVVVNRDFRSLSGMSATPTGNLFIVDRKSIGMFEIVPTHLIVQL